MLISRISIEKCSGIRYISSTTPTKQKREERKKKSLIEKEQSLAFVMKLTNCVLHSQSLQAICQGQHRHRCCFLFLSRSRFVHLRHKNQLKFSSFFIRGHNSRNFDAFFFLFCFTFFSKQLTNKQTKKKKEKKREKNETRSPSNRSLSRTRVD